MRVFWLGAALILCAAVAALNLLAIEHFLYWRYEWFDTFMHFLGGIAIGTFLIGFLVRYRPCLFVLLFAGLVIGWEIFEYIFGLPREANYVFDTAVDLLMDTLGGLLAYILARTTLWRN